MDTILNQRGQDVVCIYCAIGQRASAVAKAVANLRDKGAMEYTVVVVTEGNDPPGLTYIAPYAATSIAEHFMEAGRDVLIVYDDLTQHARAYRELSLLLRRPPGREAFPGDIFYIHSRLLERATHLRKELGGGSLTALPIIETEAQNISAYIPTNLISITDGQINLSPSLFELGVLPAVDVAKSVSRVGGKAQRAAYRAVAGDLKLAYAQFEELETFARFGARLDEDTRNASSMDDESARASSSRSSPGIRARADHRPAGTGREALRRRYRWTRWRTPSSAVQVAAAEIPADIPARLESAADLTTRIGAIVEIARQALAPFPAQARSQVETRVRPRQPKPPQAGQGAHEQHHRRACAGRSRAPEISRSVVRTMKALAASSIGQYENSVHALADYYRTVELGLGACFRNAGRRLDRGSGDVRATRRRSARSSSAPTRDSWASSTRSWPTTRREPSARCPGEPRSGPSASAFMRASWTRACRRWTLRGAELRPRDHPARRADPDRERSAPAELTGSTSSTTDPRGASTSPVRQRLLPLDANGAGSGEAVADQNLPEVMGGARHAARAHPRIPLHLALPGVRRVPREREREPSRGDGTRRQEHRRFARGSPRRIPPPASERHR